MNKETNHGYCTNRIDVKDLFSVITNIKFQECN